MTNTSTNTNTANTDDVYMTRHGARADREIYNWKPLPGHQRDDTELSQGGLQSSEQLADRLASPSPSAAAAATANIDHIISSPFYRCVQTVAPLAKRLQLPIKIEPGLCEVLTTFPPGFWSTEDLAQDFPIDLDYKPVLSRDQLKREVGDGQAAARARRVSLELRHRLSGTMLFCGHGASCLGIAQAFGGAHDYVGYSSISHFTFDFDGQKWNNVLLGDVSHLPEPLRQQSINSAW